MYEDTISGHRNVLSRRICLFSLIAIALCLSTQAHGQGNPEQQKVGPRIESPTAPADAGIGRSRLDCAGYFRLPPMQGLPQIVGGEQEQERRIYATGDIIYIDAGSQQGIKEGQEFHVIRPRGWVERVYRKKKGNLGVFVQEIGQLRVVRVKDKVSVAQVTFACDSMLLGDLLTGVPDRPSQIVKTQSVLDRFTDSNGKPSGRVMMARDSREMLTVGDLIYVDIGAEDEAAPGDYLTIYRKVGAGGFGVIKNEELARRSDGGFASEQYRGGTFSQQAQRSKDANYEPGQYRHNPIKSSEIKKNRPEMPRKVVGEAMIVNIQVRTATAIIVSAVQEVHTGDYVQMK